MKRKIVWLAVTCLMAIALLAASCGPKVEKEVTPPEEKAPTVLPTISIGETGRGAGIAVTILEAIVTDSYQYKSQTTQETVTKEAGPGMSFLIVTAEIKNEGTITQPSGAGWMSVFDSEGREYRPTPYYGADALVSDRYLIPGAEMKGKALFQIPKGTSGLKIRYDGVANWEVK